MKSSKLRSIARAFQACRCADVCSFQTPTSCRWRSLSSPTLWPECAVGSARAVVHRVRVRWNGPQWRAAHAVYVCNSGQRSQHMTEVEGMGNSSWHVQ